MRASRWFFGWTLAVAACRCGAEGDFGRFGFSAYPQPPGFVVGREGFRADHERAAWIGFPTVVRSWTPVRVRAHEAIFTIGSPPPGPSKLRVNLFAPGFELFFEKGIALRVRSVDPPLLTWSEGSVEVDTPTPASRWIAVSFRDPQPPLLLAFPGALAALRVEGRPGDYVLRSEGEFRGWVRFALPVGTIGRPAGTASELGRLAARISSHESFWTLPPPELVGLDVAVGPDSVTGIWRFSRAGVVVPPAVNLARRGGYAVEMLTGATVLDAPSREGPLSYSAQDRIILRFPLRPLPEGRAITVGDLPERASEQSAIWKAAYELAVRSLLAGAPESERHEGATLLERLSRQIPADVREPNTGLSVLFDAEGRGLLELAASALLIGALGRDGGVDGLPNGALRALERGRDPLGWGLFVGSAEDRRRVAALAALAGALSADPRERLHGAMFEASLAAERGRGLWLRERRLGPAPARLTEPAETLRQAIFASDPDRRAGSPWTSPWRLREGPAWAIRRDGEDLVAEWTGTSADPETFRGSGPLEALEALEGLKRVELLRDGAAWEVRAVPLGPGRRRTILRFPTGAEPPESPKTTSFEEPVR